MMDMLSSRSDDDLTTRQFGDACEYLVLAELMLVHDWAGHKMPDGWPDYDLIVSKKTGAETVDDIRISVKARRVGIGRTTQTWSFKPGGWHWLALVLEG